MQITEIKIHLVDEERLKAFASVTFDNCFVVRNMKVVVGERGLLLCMPARKTATHEHWDLAHPITREFRSYLEKHILDAYQSELAGRANHSKTEVFPADAQHVF